MLPAVTAPRTIGVVLDDSIKLWRAAFIRTWRLSTLSACLHAIPYLWMLLRWSLGSDPLPPSIYESGSLSFTLLALAVQIASIPVSYAMLLQTAAVATRTPQPLRDSLSKGISLLPRWLGVTFLICLIALIAFVPAFVVLIVTQLFDSLKGAVGGLLVLIVYLPAVVYMYGRFLLFPIYMVVGDAGVLESLEGSWYLTRGHWWRAVATWAILVTLFLVVALLCAISILGIYELRGAAPASYPQVLESFIPIVSAFWYPLFYAGNLNMFIDLKARSEGSDLAHRFAALGPT